MSKPPRSSPILATAISASLALSLWTAPSSTLACNPDDCGGLSKRELARDKAEIRRMNRDQARYVRQRDAQYARGWQAQRDHKAAVADYERQMAEWREAVRRCRAGDRRYCGG